MTKIDEIGGLMSQSVQLYALWAHKKGLNYNSLAVFYGALNYQHCTQKQISTQWSLPKQTVFSVCKQLHAQGLLDFEPAQQDKREKILTLTAKGEAFARPIVDEIRAIEMQVVQSFGEQEIVDFIEKLQQFNQIVAQHTQE